MCYKGADKLRYAIPAGLFIYPGYQVYLQQSTKKRLTEASQGTQTSPDAKEKSSQASADGLGQIKHFQTEVHSSNIGNSLQVTKNDIKLAKKGAQLET